MFWDTEFSFKDSFKAIGFGFFIWVITAILLQCNMFLAAVGLIVVLFAHQAASFIVLFGYGFMELVRNIKKKEAEDEDVVNESYMRAITATSVVLGIAFLSIVWKLIIAFKLADEPSYLFVKICIICSLVGFLIYLTRSDATDDDAVISDHKRKNIDDWNKK